MFRVRTTSTCPTATTSDDCRPVVSRLTLRGSKIVWDLGREKEEHDDGHDEQDQLAELLGSDPPQNGVAHERSFSQEAAGHQAIDRRDRFRSGRAIDPSPAGSISPDCPIAADRTRSWVASSMVEDGHLAAFAHDQDAVAHREHLGQVRADQDDRHSPRGQLVDQLVDLGLGADVDAASRLVEDQDLRVASPATC